MQSSPAPRVRTAELATSTGNTTQQYIRPFIRIGSKSNKNWLFVDQAGFAV